MIILFFPLSLVPPPGNTTDDYTYEYDLTPVTGINADGQGHNYKVAKDGRIYIVRDGRWYTTTGIQIR